MGFSITAEIDLQFNPGKLAPGDEVHYAGYGIGAVQC